LRTFVR